MTWSQALGNRAHTHCAYTPGGSEGRIATREGLVAIPLAAGALASAGIVLSPAVGAVPMLASTVVVALNAQLLRRVRLDLAELAGA